MKRVLLLLATIFLLLPNSTLAENTVEQTLELIASITDVDQKEAIRMLEEKLNMSMKEVTFAPHQSIYLPQALVNVQSAYSVVPFLEIDADKFSYGVYFFSDKDQAENLITKKENVYFTDDTAWTMEKSIEVLPSLLELWGDTHATLDASGEWMAYTSNSDEPLYTIDGVPDIEVVKQMLKEDHDWRMSPLTLTISSPSNWHFQIIFLDGYGLPPIVVYTRFGAY